MNQELDQGVDPSFQNMWKQLSPEQQEQFMKYGAYMYGNMEEDLAAIEVVAQEMEKAKAIEQNLQKKVNQ